jgi:hypothetical protein
MSTSWGPSLFYCLLLERGYTRKFCVGAAVQAKIDALPGWQYGGVGILGLNFTGTTDWLTNAVPNSTSQSPSIALTGYAHNIQSKYFWRNNANLNVSGLKFVNKDLPEVQQQDSLQIVNNSFNVSSLFGYKLTETIAISALGEYRTVVLGNTINGVDSEFNNPGYLDIGVGVTWTPIKNLVVVLHPINYNIVFPSANFESSLGTKYVVDYTRNLPMGIAWTSNITGFFSYKNVENPNLHSFNWTNGFSFTAFKGIGVSAQLVLRRNAQEAFKFGGITSDDNNLTQLAYVVGLSYSL